MTSSEYFQVAFQLFILCMVASASVQRHRDFLPKIFFVLLFIGAGTFDLVPQFIAHIVAVVKAFIG